jgi:hypothetical protein
MLIIALVLFVMLAVAAFCALRLARTPQAPVKVEASPMRATLERRIRDGADFRV